MAPFPTLPGGVGSEIGKKEDEKRIREEVAKRKEETKKSYIIKR